jgi:ribosomal protein S28E/S33
MGLTTRKVSLDESEWTLALAICKRTGMTQTEMLGRVVTWITRQDELIQAIVLDLVSEANIGDVLSLLQARREAKEAGEEMADAAERGAAKLAESQLGSGRASA